MIFLIKFSIQYTSVALLTISLLCPEIWADNADAIPRQEFKVLISNNIRSIAADADDVWLATNAGVSRYSQKDRRWTSYTKEDGLVSDNIYIVTSDGEEVWFGTDNGVSRYRPAENKWETYREKDGLISNKINCITRDRNYIWIGTDRGLARFDTNISSWAARTQADGLTTDLVTSVAVEKDSVWVGTEIKRGPYEDDWSWRENKRRSGINRYDKNTDSWNTYTAEEGLMSGQVSTIAADEDTVWIGTADAGISCYSKKDQAFVKSYSKSEILDTNNIKSIFVDGIYTWIGTANSGIYRYIKTTDTWMQYTIRDGLASNHVTSIAVSGDEVWFGSNENGLSKYNKLTQKWTKYVKASYPADNDVRWIQADGNEVWAATTRGLSRYNTEEKKWTTYGVKDGLAEEHITHLELFDNDVFLPMANGLARLDRETGKWRFYTDFINSSSFVTALEAANSLFIGTSDAGVFSLQTQDEDSPECFLTPDQLPASEVTCIEVNNGKIWIGTRYGLFSFDMDGQPGKMFTQADGLASDHVNVVARDGDDLWVGTSGGLSKYNISDSSWQIFSSRNGFPSDNVRALATTNEGKIWVGTPRGLALLDRISDTEYEIKTALFSESKSSFYNNMRSISIAGSTLWIATAAGAINFEPSSGQWWEHRAEPRKTPFIESGVTTIEFDDTDVWVSNWNSSAFGCIARFDRISKSWLRYDSRDILNTQPDEKTTSITTVGKIIPEAHCVWFTTDWGILKYNKELGIWRHYTTTDGLVDNNIRAFVLGGDTAWASSSGRKINKYDVESDKWLIMRFRHSGGGMDENPIEREGEWRLEDIERREQEDRWSSVRDLIVDDGSIWLRMGDGITLFNQYTKELKQFTVKDGMASDRVRCLEYDGRHVWVGHESDQNSGTRGGISRYDTVAGEWTGYTDMNILADDRIDRILVSKDLVWFLPDRHSRSGATGYDTGRDNWFILKPKAESDEDNHDGGGFQGGIVEVVSDNENIWVGSMWSGLLQFHTASDSWRFLSDKENVYNNILMRDGLKVDENSVWVGTMGGLRLYNKELETWTTYTKPVSLTGSEVRAIAVDDQYVWCGTNQGISRYDKMEGLWTLFQSMGGRIEIKIGNDQREWWRQESREGLMDNSITGLAVDDQYLWITTQRGANRYDKTADIWDRYSQRNGLPTNNLTAVAADGSDVWLSTSKGLCRYPRMSDDPNAWITYTSMIEIRPMVFSQEYASSLISNKISAVAAEKDYIWAGTERGVSRYDKKQDTWRTFTRADGLANDKISCIATDEDSIWFGTANGVTRFSRRTNDWITFTIEDGLPSDQVTCIAIDTGSVWFGTFDAGLARYDEDTSLGQDRNRWIVFTEGDGLAHNSVLSMAVDGNFLWVGTRRGLTRYDKRTDTWTIYREY